METDIYHHKINLYEHKLKEKNEKYNANQASSSELCHIIDIPMSSYYKYLMLTESESRVSHYIDNKSMKAFQGMLKSEMYY